MLRLLTAAALAVALAPTACAPAAANTGCVSRAEYRSVYPEAWGKNITYLQSRVGADALVSTRYTSTPPYRIQERKYALCGGYGPGFTHLTARWSDDTRIAGNKWRAFMIDDCVGPDTFEDGVRRCEADS